MAKEVTAQDIEQVVTILTTVDAQEQRSMHALEGELSVLLLHSQLLRKLGEQILGLGVRKATNDDIRATIHTIETAVFSRFGTVLIGKMQDPELEAAFIDLEKQLQTLSHIQFFSTQELARQKQAGTSSELARRIQKEINRIPLGDIVVKLRILKNDWKNSQHDKEHALIEEYKLLHEIETNLSNATPEQRNEWASRLAQDRIIITSILGRQKELLTEWNTFLKEQRTMESIVGRLAKEETITKNALKNIIATFTHPHEFTDFFGKIIKYRKKFEDKEKTLDSLSRGSTYAARQAEIRNALAQTQSDALTGIPLRPVCEKTVSAELGRSRRLNRQFSILVIDVDKFKEVNDFYDHQTGDEALKLIASACRRALRDTDSFCRWGGEEFIVILPEVGKSAAILTALRLRETVISQSTPFAKGHSLLKRESLTISTGVATFPDDGQSEEVLFARADNAVLHGAKPAGRNCVAYYDGDALKTTTEPLKEEPKQRTATGVTKRFFSAVKSVTGSGQ